MAFILGFGAALLVATDDGKKVLNNVTKAIGTIAENVVKGGADMLKEAMPDTAKILGVGKNDISTETDKTDTGK